jgi:glycosyltransferase involved in cell wall biosynthesis
MSIVRQSSLPDEVVICDDGSNEETKDLIVRFQKIFPVPLIHVWQPDEGFQLAKIRNKGICRSTMEYIIQIDGDLILHQNFVEDHKKFARPNSFTTGSRVLLSLQTTNRVFNEKSVEFSVMNEKNILNSIRIPWLSNFLSSRYKQKGKDKFYVKGCNMAFWKSDLLKVNGYNEDFVGWGREDSEIAIRLINAGVQKRFLKFGGICYHLWHNEASKSMEKENVEKMNLAIANKTTLSPKGLNQYLLSDNG